MIVTKRRKPLRQAHQVRLQGQQQMNLGQSVVYLKRSITFSNGCQPIEVNETVFCSMTENCDNELEVEYTLTPTLLTITETQTINSPIHNDSGLMVSIDGGVTFNEYTSPITLVGGEEIVITHTIEFSDS